MDEDDKWMDAESIIRKTRSSLRNGWSKLDLFPGLDIFSFDKIAHNSSLLDRLTLTCDTLRRLACVSAVTRSIPAGSIRRDMLQLRCTAQSEWTQKESQETCANLFFGSSRSRLTLIRLRPGIQPKLEALKTLYEGKKIIVGRDKLDVVKGVLQKVDQLHHTVPCFLSFDYFSASRI